MKKYIVIFSLILLVVPVIALAQTANPCSLAYFKSTNGDSSTLPKCVNQIYVWSLGVAALLALLMIILGGYYYMTAGGNAEQSSKGVEFINSALIGVVILFCAYLLLHEINPDLVNFNINSLNNLNQSTTPTTIPATNAPTPTQQQPAQPNTTP